MRLVAGKYWVGKKYHVFGIAGVRGWLYVVKLISVCKLI